MTTERIIAAIAVPASDAEAAENRPALPMRRTALRPWVACGVCWQVGGVPQRFAISVSNTARSVHRLPGTGRHTPHAAHAVTAVSPV
jgi:hypothetical protein